MNTKYLRFNALTLMLLASPLISAADFDITSEQATSVISTYRQLLPETTMPSFEEEPEIGETYLDMAIKWKNVLGAEMISNWKGSLAVAGGIVGVGAFLGYRYYNARRTLDENGTATPRRGFFEEVRESILGRLRSDAPLAQITINFGTQPQGLIVNATNAAIEHDLHLQIIRDHITRHHGPEYVEPMMARICGRTQD